jgi:hypothetical protein
MSVFADTSGLRFCGGLGPLRMIRYPLGGYLRNRRFSGSWRANGGQESAPSFETAIPYVMCPFEM